MHLIPITDLLNYEIFREASKRNSCFERKYATANRQASRRYRNVRKKYHIIRWIPKGF